MIAATLFLALSLYTFHRLEQFLIRDSRFALNGPDGSAEPSTIEIQGAEHAPAAPSKLFSRTTWDAAFICAVVRSPRNPARPSTG